MKLLRITLPISIILPLCLLSTAASGANKKICVLTDIHVMAPSLLEDENNKEWQEYLKTSKSMIDLSVPIFDAIINKIILEKPDLLLIVGDLTKDSEVESHNFVLNKLTKFKQSNIPVYVIPGNHDRGWMQRALIFKNDTCVTAETIDNDGFEKLYVNYGYGPDTERYGTTLNYLVEPFPGLTLICIDSLVMMHHMIMPHYYYQNNIFELSVPTDYSDIRDKFMQAGIKVVLSGHSHTSDITRYVDASGRELYDVGTGSPISYPCDYRVLTFDDTFSRLSIVTKSLTTLDGYPDFPSYAKERLKESVKNWTQKWMVEKTGFEFEDDEEFGNNNLVISVLSQALSNSFTIHAEGNEPDNPESKEAVLIFEDFLDYMKRHNLDNAEIIENISLSMKSILGDYPSENDKYNIVNDRTLTIQMPNLTDGIKEIVNNETKKSAWYTLEGVQLSEKPQHPGVYIYQGRKHVIK